jgi:hypothetical protein
MERAEERRILWLDTKRAFETSTFYRSRVKTQRQTVRIYGFGNLGVDEMFTRLPELFLRQQPAQDQESGSDKSHPG